MKIKKETKKNALIGLAALCLICVFLMSSCVGSILAGGDSYRETEIRPDDSFAIINISGTIQAAPDSPVDTKSYNHSRLMDYIDELTDDESNHGILLKVNSGGGTVYHSDEMYLKLMEYKEKTGRPVQAYFEQTAASGAYYISCAADNIMANRNCWTGSIGVILSYVDVSELYGKLGVKEILITSGENKGMGSAGTPLTEEQYAIYKSLVDEHYNTFAGIVSQSRGIEMETLRPIADGRIYTARQALENGLIDEIGLWEDAVKKMEEETGCEGYERKYYSEATLLDYLLYGMADIAPKSDVQALNESVSSELNGVPLYMYR